MGGSYSRQASPPAWLMEAVDSPEPLTFASRLHIQTQQLAQPVQHEQGHGHQQGVVRADAACVTPTYSMRSKSCGMARPPLAALPVQRLTSEMLFPQLREPFDGVPLQPGFIKTQGMPGFSIAEAAANARHAKMLLEGLSITQSSQQSPTGVASYSVSPHTASAPASRSASPGPLLTSAPACIASAAHVS